MSLKEIKIKGAYRTSNDDDALNSFYIPCLKNSIEYKRKAGYFSSSIFQIADQGFRDFFKNNGKIQLLVSHLFVKDDTEILKNNPTIFFDEVGKEYKKKFQQYIEKEISPEKVELFATLLANKRLEIKIHYIPSNSGAAYHAKVGIFKDLNDDSVMFIGGINESTNAWHNMSDEIHIQRSWDSEQAEENLKDYHKDFDRIWNNIHLKQDWQTADLPKALQEDIIKYSNTESDLDELFDRANTTSREKPTSKTYFKKEIDRFILQAQGDSQKTKNYAKKLEEFDVEVSFGKGNLARIPWIAFLGENMQVSNGYYPVYLYYKEKNILILSYGISETIKIDSNKIWSESIRETEPQIKNIFPEIQRYGDSFLYKSYEVNISNNEVSYFDKGCLDNYASNFLDEQLKSILNLYRIALREDKNYQNKLKINNNQVINNFQHELYSHQKNALKAWRENNNQAIFKHVTGSGKTVTACHAIEEMLNIGKKCLVIVPSTALLSQWEEEIRKILGGVQIFLSSNTKSWKTCLENSKAETTSNAIFLTTLQTARLSYFRENFYAGEHIFLVVDECHSLWAKESNKVLSHMHWNDCPRMALSATPDDTSFSDEIIIEDNKELTQIISFEGEESILIDENSDKTFHIRDLKKEEFGKIDVIDFFKGDSKKEGDDRFTHKLSIGDAINSYPPILSRYWYFFKTVYLTEEETKKFLKKSQLIASYMGDPDKKNDLKKELLLRQRIINIANNKRNAVEKLLDKNKNTDDSDHNLFQQKWVVYVGAGKTNKEGNFDKKHGMSEIDWVYEYIDRGLNYEKNFYCYKYDGTIKKKERRKEILDDFDKTGGVIFACKMLDEGVDIPRLSRAIIMASSGNDREFIQRRGRVLRINRGNTGDSVSKIWDLIVLPDPSVAKNDKKVLNSIKNHVKKETKRLRIFANDAENKISITDKIEELENKWGIND